MVEVKVAPEAAPPPPPRITAGAPGAGVAGVVGVAVGLVVADGLGEGEGLAGAEGVAVGNHPDPGATFTTETLAGSNCRMMS
ncbi:MAG: hypothetical protein IPI85_02075 [Dehalococcoidia bacterium]|nr:hypothetical protein [Dehalococcoidia bacterium]